MRCGAVGALFRHVLCPNQQSQHYARLRLQRVPARSRRTVERISLTQPRAACTSTRCHTTMGPPGLSASTASTAPSTAECANKQQQAGILASHSNIRSLVWVGGLPLIWGLPVVVCVLVHRHTSPSPSQQAAPSYQVYHIPGPPERLSQRLAGCRSARQVGLCFFLRASPPPHEPTRPPSNQTPELLHKALDAKATGG